MQRLIWLKRPVRLTSVMLLSGALFACGGQPAETSSGAATPEAKAQAAGVGPEASSKMLQEHFGHVSHGAAAAASSSTICPQAASKVAQKIATQAAWDAQWADKYGTTVPNLSGDGQTFAWQGYYDVRAYVSMAETFGDTKYLDRAVTTINYWFDHTDGGPAGQGWAHSYGQSQAMLDTGVIAQAITTFAYEVWKDSRFTAYRSTASSYIAKLEPMLHAYDDQWVSDAPYPGAPGDWVYASCGSGGSLCSSASLVMYNQSATMAKSLLLISRIYQMKGLTPNPAYLAKAAAVAAYFKTFVTTNGSAYSWSYGGARTAGNGPEDISHGDLDLSLVNWAEHFGLGGLTSADMKQLVGTENAVFNGGSGPDNVAFYVNGTGAANSYYIPAVGWSWIDVTDFDTSGNLFNKTVTLFNAYPMTSNPAGYFLGWAEILRKKRCVALY